MQNKVLEEIFRRSSTNPSGSEVLLKQLSSSRDAAIPSGAEYQAATSLPTDVFASLFGPGQLPSATSTGTSHQRELTAQSEAFSALIGSTGLNAAESQAGQQNPQGSTRGSPSQLSELFGTLSKNLESLRSASDAQTAVVSANTQAVTINTSGKGASQALASVGKVANGLFGGLSALPIVSGIMKLFGGDNSTAAPPLQKYAAPPQVRFESVSQNQSGTQTMESTGYDRYGSSRAGTAPILAIPSYASFVTSATSGSIGETSSGRTAAESVSQQGLTQNSPSLNRPTTQVTVNVQAMDSRSFLDRSHDIAQAVREAMLNMHSINDVVNDL